MAIPKMPEDLLTPPRVTLMNYDDLLQGLEGQKALAREMIATAREMSRKAMQMKKELRVRESLGRN